ncbi:MAG: hypothetical protein JWN48_4948 [Myxococcaceae bacterium]|nr:hypothetical protein [Myxococcaceae bacterium]
MRGTRATSAAALLTLATALSPTLALAHISLVSGPGYANTTQELTFGVGHGCSGSDTYSVKIDIPAGVTSVRAETSGLGNVSVQRDAMLNVTSVTWQKADADVLKSDDNYYKLTIRVKVPNAPFTTVYFPAHQTCRAADGTTLPVVDWVATAETPADDAGPAAEPAPALVILPARQPGWNKFTVPVAVADLSKLFGDAQIVWKDTAAYSANTTTADQIKSTAGVSVLTTLAAGDTVWVKY